MSPADAAKRARRAAIRVALSGWRRLPRPVMGSVYRATIWLAARVLETDGVAVYVRGGFGRGDAVIGSSDVDLVVVVDDTDPDVGAERRSVVTQRYRALRRWLPSVRLLVDLDLFGRADVADAADGPSRVFGLERGQAAHLRTDPAPLELLIRPGTKRATGDWRLLAGIDQRPAIGDWDRDRLPVAAWLEVQHIWRGAAPLAIEPDRAGRQYRALRLVVDSARVWYRLATGRHLADRASVLRDVPAELRQTDGLPPLGDQTLDEVRTINADPSAPRPVLDPTPWLDWLTHLTELIIGQLTASLADCQTTSVRLIGGGSPADDRALVDWRTLVVPVGQPERWRLDDGDPADPSALRQAALAFEPHRYRALMRNELMVKPSQGWANALWRTAQFPVSDPVSFTQAASRDLAVFTDAPGWSAADVAQRSVNEHRAFLASKIDEWGTLGVSRLLTAARGSLFWQSIRSQEPELLLDLNLVVQRLAREPTGEWLADQTTDSLVACGHDGDSPDQGAAERLADLVIGLPQLS